MFFDDPRMPKYMELYEKYSNQSFDATVYPLDNEQYADKLFKYMMEYGESNIAWILLEWPLSPSHTVKKAADIKIIYLKLIKFHVDRNNNLVISSVQDDDPKYDGISFYETNHADNDELYEVLSIDSDDIKLLNEFVDYLAAKHSEDEEILKYILSYIDKASALLDEVMAQLPEKTSSPLPASAMSEYSSLIRQQRDISLNDLKTKLRASM